MITVLGAFDGFHLGHRSLMAAAQEFATQRGGEWAVVTFAPHPARVLRTVPQPVLFTEAEKDFLARYLGIPSVVRIPFTRELGAMAPGIFLDALAEKFPLDGIVTGQDFRFGRNREGDSLFLEGYCRSRGWALKIVPPLLLKGEKVGSSAIRMCILGGDALQARDLLGYPFFVQGRVIRGDGRGRTLGFPTANVRLPHGKIIPKSGVYAASLALDGEWWPGALNVGNNPTFLRNGEVRAEIHIIGYEGDLYGREIRIFIERFIREEMTFSSAGDLQAQMRQDMETTRTVFRSHMRDFASQYHGMGDLSKGVAPCSAS